MPVPLLRSIPDLSSSPRQVCLLSLKAFGFAVIGPQIAAAMWKHKVARARAIRKKQQRQSQQQQQQQPSKAKSEKTPLGHHISSDCETVGLTFISHVTTSSFPLSFFGFALTFPIKP